MLIHGEQFKAFTMICIEKSNTKVGAWKKTLQLCLYVALSFYHNFMIAASGEVSGENRAGGL